MRTTPVSVFSNSIALAILLGLGACSKQSVETTPGQHVDAAIAKLGQETQTVVVNVEQKGVEALTALKTGIDSAVAASPDVVRAAKVQLADATISASVNAELALDPELSPLKIAVATNAGRVALRGTAPDAAARDRAAALAQRVSGVAGVDNQLEIRKN